MLRWVRRLLLVVLALVLVVGLLVAMSIKPDLDGRARAVDRAWPAVATALDRRAAALGRAGDALAARGARDIAASITDAIGRWHAATSAPTALADRVDAANGIESLVTRVVPLARTAPYANDTAVQTAVADLRAAAPTAAAVTRLDDAIDDANRVRNNLVRRLVARALGRADLPQLVPAPASE